jgi:putative redox protein
MASVVTVKSVDGSRFEQQITAGPHTLHGDEPGKSGGDNLGPSPYDFLLIALGTCTSMTLGMYARRKQWDLQGVQVDLRHERIHAADCEDCESETGLLDQIHSEIRLTGDLDEAQRARLLEIATRCPVRRTLTSEIKIRSSLVG